MTPFKTFVKSLFTSRWWESVVILASPLLPPIARLLRVLRPRHSDHAPGTLRRARRNGIRYELDISDWVEWNIYFRNRVEPREKIYALARPGDTVIDVGVNVGETLLNLARQVGPTGTVIGFEPNPTVLRKCLLNIQLNPDIQNVTVHSLALGSEEQELFIEARDARNQGMHSLSATARGEKVRVTPLDDFLRREPVPRLDLIKIDAEGFEMNVLRGAERSVLRFRPRLFVEIDDDLLKLQRSSAEELVQWLAARGYELSNAEDGTPVIPGQPFAHCHLDVICQQGHRP